MDQWFRRVRSASMVMVVAALLFPLLALPSTAQTVAATVTPQAENSQPAEMTVFWGDGCARCAEQDEWLDANADRYPGLDVVKYEVWNDAANRERFRALGAEMGFDATSVPTTVIDQRVWIGWTDQIARDVEAALDNATNGLPVPAGVYGTPGAGTCTEDDLQCDGDTGASISMPLIGDVNLADQSLLVATLAIGFVDGVNPCSLWVISILLAIVLRTGSRRRVIAVGTTFLLVTAAMYGLFMVGIYSALTIVGFLGAIQVVVALAAGIFGVVSVKDYFAFKKGISFTIADSAKPGIYQRARAAAAHRSLIPALAATAALGVAVSLLELPCTAGFPVLWAGLLQANGVGLAEAGGLYVAYMVPYLLDEMIVFGVAVVTMRATKMQEKHGQVLKLVAGTTMLALAGAIVVDPAIMENPVLALALFTGAILAAVLIHLVTTQVRTARAAARASGDLQDPGDDGGAGGSGHCPDLTDPSGGDADAVDVRDAAVPGR
ncbi:hypothetical protein [Cellulomonas bogoriensis]|uniref:hypothetical protein n=1 Tax=Cellulomonas bogoriensis TaxID=301388 RepID=UPI0012EC5508|nr:hypothetical protein [Cellulomonas bogoriensis]